MKKLLLTALAVSLIIGAGCARPGATTPAVAAPASTPCVVVDAAILTARSKPGQKAARHLDSVRRILQQGLDDLVKTYKGKNTPEAVNAVNRARATLDRELQAQRQIVSVEMDRLIREAVRKWQGKRAVIVLPAAGLLGHSPQSDVTSAVLKELDKLPITLPEAPKVSVRAPGKK